MFPFGQNFSRSDTSFGGITPGQILHQRGVELAVRYDISCYAFGRGLSSNAFGEGIQTGAQSTLHNR